MSEKSIVLSGVLSTDDVESLGSVDDIAIGQWYWLKDVREKWNADRQDYDRTPFEWLGCLMAIGSNYVLIQEPRSDRHGYRERRVHINDFYTSLRREFNPEGVIAGYIAGYQKQLREQIQEVKSITSRLGVSNSLSIAEKRAESSGTAVAVMSGQFDIKAYETELKKAKDTDLPELFEQIKNTNVAIAKWMSAEMLPLQAEASILNGTIEAIGDRVFNVGLYSGLIEHVVNVRDGEPAPFHEKLRVMQRLLFMDEECLLDYQHGGMTFKKIEQFDAWLSKPSNMERILPFPRCMVAMRVRRNIKKRIWDGTIGGIFMDIEEARSDKWTFLFIRNGEKLYRLGCDSFEFDGLEGMIFPDKALFDPSEPMMCHVGSFASDRKLMTVADYEQRCAQKSDWAAKHKQWEIDNPFETWKDFGPDDEKHGQNHLKYLWEHANPFRSYNSPVRDFNPDAWKPFNDSTVHYDDFVKDMTDRIKKYNRIALLIQGLFDRSDALHPHPPVKTWVPESFAACVELVYDGSHVLYSGPEPDIEAFFAKCNATLNKDSVVIGQELFWEQREAEKENTRRQNDWRDSNKHMCEVYRPYGNPGPGYLAKMKELKPRSGKAVFTWERKRLTDRWRHDETLPVSIAVPVERLFNVSGYQPGEFLQFFRDPRTRAKYLQWAPLLIAAEEFHAGNVNAQEPTNNE